MHRELDDSQRRSAVTVSRSDSQYLHNDSTAAVQCGAQARYAMHTANRNVVSSRQIHERRSQIHHNHHYRRHRHYPTSLLQSSQPSYNHHRRHQQRFLSIQQCQAGMSFERGTRFSPISFQFVPISLPLIILPGELDPVIPCNSVCVLIFFFLSPFLFLSSISVQRRIEFVCTNENFPGSIFRYFTSFVFRYGQLFIRSLHVESMENNRLKQIKML